MNLQSHDVRFAQSPVVVLDQEPTDSRERSANASASRPARNCVIRRVAPNTDEVSAIGSFRGWFYHLGCVLLLCGVHAGTVRADETVPLRAGMIGLDTSHVIAFAKIFNDKNATGDIAKVRIVAGYPGGTDIPASRDRVGKFTQQLREQGIEIVETIPELLQKVDVVLLESVDGRIHWEEARHVIEAKKPMFIDKPIAGTLADAIKIFEFAKQHDVAVWSASSIRYASSFQSLLENDSVGEIVGCAAWGPCKYQPGTPDMFFYGVHGIEGLFTVMGTGCESVSRVVTEDTDVLVGVWEGGRIGTFRGIRKGKTDFGATAFGTKGIATVNRASAYQQLCSEIATFFLTGNSPVSAHETTEIFAFMEAADESKRRGGASVSIAKTIEDASGMARQALAQLQEAAE